MKFLRPTLRVLLLAGVVSAAFTPLARSATINWTGDSSGNWVDGANWLGGVAPNSSSTTAGLINVTTGTRTITIGSTDNIIVKSISLSQTTAGAANNLYIASGGTLTVSSGVSTISGATAGSARIDVAGTLAFGVGTTYIGADVSLVNGGKLSVNAASTTTFSFYAGTVNVDAGVGGVSQFYNGASAVAVFGSATVLNVNSGTLELYENSVNGAVSSMALGGVTTIASGASIKLSTSNLVTGGSSGTTFLNTGTLTQAGTISLNGRGNNATNGLQTLTNSGTWVVSGSGAVIEKLTNNSSLNPTFTNTVGGIIRGVGTLTYNHLQTPGTKLVSTNAGTIQMGDGSQGTGVASIGSLELKNFALTLASTSKLEFDLGGLTTGLYDTFTLTSSTMTLGGDLAIYLVNGFDPTSDFSLDLILGGSTVTGSFTNLWVNGVSDSRYSFAVNNGIGTLSFTSVPEPQVWHLLAAGVVFGLWSIRRRRNGTGQL